MLFFQWWLILLFKKEHDCDFIRIKLHLESLRGFHSTLCHIQECIKCLVMLWAQREGFRNMGSSEKSNWLVTMLMLRTEWQMYEWHMHKLCKHYFRGEAPAWRSPDIWLFLSLKNSAERNPWKYNSVNHCLDIRLPGGCSCHLFHCKKEPNSLYLKC